MRLYHVVVINERTKLKYYLSRPLEPMTHHEACTFKSKMMDYPGRIVMLEEAVK